MVFVAVLLGDKRVQPDFSVLGERVLGLPGEPRVDKDVAWKDIPT